MPVGSTAYDTLVTDSQMSHLLMYTICRLPSSKMDGLADVKNSNSSWKQVEKNCQKQALIEIIGWWLMLHLEAINDEWDASLWSLLSQNCNSYRFNLYIYRCFVQVFNIDIDFFYQKWKWNRLFKHSFFNANVDREYDT